MPTYEYACDGCGHRFERFQRMTAAPLSECPECGGPVRRLIGPGSAVLMRGGGATEAGARTACDRPSPCCGRSERCDAPPCGER